MKVKVRRRDPETAAPAPRGITHLTTPPGKAVATFPLDPQALMQIKAEDLSEWATMAGEVSRAFFMERQRRNHDTSSPLYATDASTRDHCLKRVHEFFQRKSRNL